MLCNTQDSDQFSGTADKIQRRLWERCTEAVGYDGDPNNFIMALLAPHHSRCRRWPTQCHHLEIRFITSGCNTLGDTIASTPELSRQVGTPRMGKVSGYQQDPWVAATTTTRRQVTVGIFWWEKKHVSCEQSNGQGRRTPDEDDFQVTWLSTPIHHTVRWQSGGFVKSFVVAPTTSDSDSGMTLSSLSAYWKNTF